MREGRYRIDDKKYNALHQWVSYHLGSPKECRNPDCKGVSTLYQWANISQEYKRDLSDWQRLCASCHKAYDINNTCRKGHELTPENTVISGINNSTGNVMRKCRTCRVAYEKEAWLRRKLKMKEEATK